MEQVRKWFPTVSVFYFDEKETRQQTLDRVAQNFLFPPVPLKFDWKRENKGMVAMVVPPPLDLTMPDTDNGTEKDKSVNHHHSKVIIEYQAIKLVFNETLVEIYRQNGEPAVELFIGRSLCLSKEQIRFLADYCQCSSCTMAWYNPFKYLFGSSYAASLGCIVQTGIATPEKILIKTLKHVLCNPSSRDIKSEFSSLSSNLKI
jgi:hypothetical protein